MDSSTEDRMPYIHTYVCMYIHTYIHIIRCYVPSRDDLKYPIWNVFIGYMQIQVIWMDPGITSLRYTRVTELKLPVSGRLSDEWETVMSLSIFEKLQNWVPFLL